MSFVKFDFSELRENCFIQHTDFRSFVGEFVTLINRLCMNSQSHIQYFQLFCSHSVDIRYKVNVISWTRKMFFPLRFTLSLHLSSFYLCDYFHVFETTFIGSCCCWLLLLALEMSIENLFCDDRKRYISDWQMKFTRINHTCDGKFGKFRFSTIVKWFRLIFTCLNPPWTQQLTRWLNKWRGISHHIHNSHEQILKCYWFWLFGWLNIAFNIEHKNIFLSSTWKWLRELVSLVQLLKFDSISSSWMYCLLYNQISHQSDDSLTLSQLNTTSKFYEQYTTYHESTEYEK